MLNKWKRGRSFIIGDFIKYIEVYDMNYSSKYELGMCTDENIVYLNIKGILDKNFSHLHLTDTDVKQLIKDLQLIEKLKEKGVTSFKINYNNN